MREQEHPHETWPTRFRGMIRDLGCPAVGSLVALGTQIPRAQEPDAGEGCVQLLDQPLGDSGEHKLQIQTRSHLQCDALEDLPASSGR